MIAPISDARLDEALAILDRLGPAGSTGEHSEPVASAAAAVPASEPATVVEHPAATPGAAFAASAPSGTQLGLEVAADVAATSELVTGSPTQPVAAACPSPSKRARTERWRTALAEAQTGQQVQARWTDAEDAALLEHVAQHGTTEWARCVEKVGGGRTCNAVSMRWHRDLKETVTVTSIITIIEAYCGLSSTD